MLRRLGIRLLAPVSAGAAHLCAGPTWKDWHHPVSCGPKPGPQQPFTAGPQGYPLTLDIFNNQLTQKPLIAQALASHTQESNVWTITAMMRHHDQEERTSILDRILGYHPDHTRDRKRPIVSQ